MQRTSPRANGGQSTARSQAMVALRSNDLLERQVYQPSDVHTATHRDVISATRNLAIVRARAQKQEVTIDTLLKITLDISCAVSEAKLANSLLDVSRCAEQISRRHPLVECSTEQIEEALEQEGAAARICMKLARRKKAH